MTRTVLTWFGALVAQCMVITGAVAQSSTPELPDAPGKDTVQRVCGACHPPTIVLGHGMSREGWGQVVSAMITRGAKGTPADFATVTDYLAKNLPVGQHAAPTATRRSAAHSFSAGPSDRQVVDPEAADRGKQIYTSDCGGCHGPNARGTAKGSDLVRSLPVLHDRYGNVLSPYLMHDHPPIGGKPLPKLTAAQLSDLGNYLHQQVEDTLRSGPYTKVLNVLTGDAKAGAAYFNGAGECAKCHSATGDLAGIASRYDAPTLQQRLLFPRTVSLGRGAVTAVKPITVTVVQPNGESVSGTLLRMDDFNVALRDASGAYHSWKRNPDLKVDIHDPYAAHEELLDRITDPEIHNLVAYLETLK